MRQHITSLMILGCILGWYTEVKSYPDRYNSTVTHYDVEVAYCLDIMGALRIETAPSEWQVIASLKWFRVHLDVWATSYRGPRTLKIQAYLESPSGVVQTWNGRLVRVRFPIKLPEEAP